MFLSKLSFIIVYTRLLPVFSQEDLSSSEGCPDGWVESIEGCFYFHSTQTLSWLEAQAACESIGGYLAEPQTEDQAVLLRSLATLEQSNLGADIWWIGLTDLMHEGRWLWANSVTDLTYSDWPPMFPRTDDNLQDCGAMEAETGFQWSDKECTELAYPLCQHKQGYNGDKYVELRGGLRNSTAVSGNVFATNSNNVFGRVCDDRWDDNDALVVCRQLGYNTGTATKLSYFGNPGEIFLFSTAGCTGSEETLQDCTHTEADHCTEIEGAGVFCSL